MKKCDSKEPLAQLFGDEAIVATLSQQLTWGRFTGLPTKLFASSVTAEGAP